MPSTQTRTVARTIDRLNKASPKVLLGKISTNRECVALWRVLALDLEALIAQGDRELFRSTLFRSIKIASARMYLLISLAALMKLRSGVCQQLARRVKCLTKTPNSLPGI